MDVVQVEKIAEDAKMPTFDKKNQYVLFAAEDTFVPANKIIRINTGVKIGFPSTYAALQINGFGLSTVGGLMDSDYRGEITAVVYSDAERMIKKGEPVMRVVMIEIELPEIVTEAMDLENSLDMCL